MKIPLNWLSEYVDLKGLTEKEISDALTMSGTENEIVKGADFPGIVVGEILEIAKHENADKLQVTKTNVGKTNGGVLQIVCGAPNIEVGQIVPVALVGTKMGEFEIAKAKIRGVESFGMLCSESELGISNDHDGIMILDPRAKIGAPLQSALNIEGTVLEAEITPNRSDCFSMIGVANEAAASLNRKTMGRNFEKAKIKSKKKVSVSVTEKKLCPRYIAKVVEGIKTGPSPKWMQEKLEACGVRPINNVVDVTNYVMLEWGQPLHAFDLSKIKGAINVRKAKPGEKIETLDGVTRKLTADDLVIADDQKAIGIAGVMGGANSEVDEKSTTIVLEAAVFEGTHVRKTAQRLGLRTEASNRFEKGIPLGLPELAIERAAQLLTEIPGGLAGIMPIVKPIAGEVTDILSAWIPTVHVGLPLHRVLDFLGVAIETPRVISILKSLGFEASEFDFKKEARSHIGKPYVFGASYKTHGNMAFDCSYLVDYIYSQIGKFVGHTALAQFELGEPVETADLRPGDVLFVNGIIEKSVTDHYYIKNAKGDHEKVTLNSPKSVGHCALYIGGGRVIHARESIWNEKTGSWKKIAKGMVVEEDVSVFTTSPQYLGARRYLDSSEGWLSVTVPWWRLDVNIEEDILEEIGRIYGFENILSQLPAGKLPIYESNKLTSSADAIRNDLVGAGYAEVLNYSFVSAKNLNDSGFEADHALRVANPISPEQEYMRLSLIPSLLKNVATNQFNFEDVRLFEIANSYIPSKKELPEERLMVGLAVRVGGKQKAQSFFEVKGACELIAQKLGIAKLKVVEGKLSGFERVAQLLVGKQNVGKILIPNSKTRQSFGIKTDLALGELDLAALIDASPTTFEYAPVSRYQQSIRDINIVFEKGVKASEIESVLDRFQGEHLKSAYIKDIYEGQGLSENEKSVTIRMVLGAAEGTLTEDDISATQSQIISYTTKTLGGKLRA